MNVTLFGKKVGGLAGGRDLGPSGGKISLLNYPAKSQISMPVLLTMDKREDRGEDGDRDWTNVAKSQGSQGMAASTSKAGRTDSH